jgi:hypothetical protein
LRVVVKVLRASVEGPCLYRPKNWLVRQLNDEPKPVYKKWDLLERKERLQLEECSRAQKSVTCCSDEGWDFYGRFNSGLVVLIGHAFHRLSQVNWFGLHLYWGKGNNLESILLIGPVADLSESVSLL